MAIVDLSASASYPVIKYLASIGTTQQEIVLPSGKLRISVGASAAACYLATSAVNDGDAMPTDKVSIPAANLLVVDLGHSGGDRIDRIAVAAQSGTANIEIILERI